MQVIHYNNNSI